MGLLQEKKVGTTFGKKNITCRKNVRFTVPCIVKNFYVFDVQSIYAFVGTRYMSYVRFTCRKVGDVSKPIVHFKAAEKEKFF